MRLFFVVIYLGLIVSARKGKPVTFSSSDESSGTDSSFIDGVLDLRGSVRREFALEAALADHARNVISSPLSVLMPLGKLAMGAGKTTGKELLKALGLSSRKKIRTVFTQLITSLEYLPGVNLDMASRIYVSSKKSLNKKFVKATERIFKSSGQKIHTSNPEKSAKTINRWVADKTRNKIKELVSSRDITDDTSVILVNAVYFSGNWMNKFEQSFTDDFFSPSGRQRVPMMSRYGRYNYWKCDTLNSQIIEIPYEGLQSSMIVVLPYTNTGLGVLLRALKAAPELLNKALAKMKITDVILSMPKFKIESELDLAPLFKKIGLRDIFDKDHSDLDGIINDETVFVSKAKQKAIIEVNENGTEASAATAMDMFKLSSGYGPTLTVNRPFLFHIISYKEQLFAGIFTGDDNVTNRSNP